MAEEFMRAVDDGIRLSKRLYFGKDRAVAPPKPLPPMERSPHLYLPAAPMVYAVIPDPSIVDNPDMPSYQPHVHGRCDPPALIPLQMNAVEVHADCFLDTALVTVTGTWRVHCVMGSKCCDCRIAVPIGEQGSILGVEVTVVRRKSYSTKLVPLEEQKDIDKTARVEDGGFLKQNIFTLRVPQVDGGSNLSIKIRWTQKLSFFEGQYTLNVPFTFPDYVTPSGKKLAKKEKIEINVNSGTDGQVLCKSTSHPLKQLRRKAGELGFLYEAEVLKWSSNDINCSYAVSSSDISGTLLLQSPSVHDVDQREVFCLYLLPGTHMTKKVFKKDIVFVIDISGSMCGNLLDTVKNTLSSALHKLSAEDSFNIIAFNSEVFQFAISMEAATTEAIEKAIQWIDAKFVPANGTNISLPLNQAIKMLSDSHGSLPMIFLVTDGTVEDERQICEEMQGILSDAKSISPRLYTFGIGTFCNHYFLRMLATIGRGQYDAAYDVDLIESRMENLFSRASSPVLSGIVMDQLEEHDLELEMYPFRIPDLLYESPLIIFGRYKGKFPDSVKVKGITSDSRSYVVDLKLNKEKDMPLDKVSAKQVIDHLTCKSWFAEDKQLEDKIVKLSIQSGVASEFTRMVLQDTSKSKESTDSHGSEKIAKNSDQDTKVKTILAIRNLCVGFGDPTSTMDNVPPGSEQVKLPEAAEIFVQAASNCCESVFNRCCCMCCIQCCSALNDQCVTVLTQVCMALACFGCLELCCGGQNN